MASIFMKFEMFFTSCFYEMFLRNVLKCLKSLTCFFGKSLKMFEIAFSPKINFCENLLNCFFGMLGPDMASITRTITHI